jgi:hypothetical protein
MQSDTEEIKSVEVILYIAEQTTISIHFAYSPDTKVTH